MKRWWSQPGSWDFLLWGSLWGLSEVFVWELLRRWHVSFKSPIMAILALLFLASAAGMRPGWGLLTAIVALSLKAAAGITFPCAMWAVFSLGIAWELLRLAASRIPKASLQVVLLSLSGPLGMLLFILYVNPAETARYVGIGGTLAFALGIPAVALGLFLRQRWHLQALVPGLAYLASLLLAVLFG